VRWKGEKKEEETLKGKEKKTYLYRNHLYFLVINSNEGERSVVFTEHDWSAFGGTPYYYLLSTVGKGSNRRRIQRKLRISGTPGAIMGTLRLLPY